MASNITVLPDEDAVHLKCSLCAAYLSVPPIKSSVDGKTYQCGRCDFSDPDINVRNFSYEKIAKFLKFPCVYENCKAKISWENVKDHELECPYRIIKCPMHECEKSMMCKEVISHFNNHHVFAKISNLTPLALHLKIPQRLYLGILIQNDASFFCFISNDGNIFKVSVYSVQYESPEKYQLIFSAPSGRKFQCPGEKIIQYNDREHCAMCFLGECHSKLHKFSTHYSNKYEMTTELEVGSIQSILNSNSVSCKIVIESTEVPDNMRIIRKTVECPICKEYMIAPIYTCNIGHLICSKCKINVSRCPLCEADFSNSRNFAVEELCENVRMTCQNDNCDFTAGLQELHVHEDSCDNEIIIAKETTVPQLFPRRRSLRGNRGGLRRNYTFISGLKSISTATSLLD